MRTGDRARESVLALEVLLPLVPNGHVIDIRKLPHDGLRIYLPILASMGATVGGRVCLAAHPNTADAAHFIRVVVPRTGQ